MNIINPSGHAADLQMRNEIVERCRRQLKKLADARKQASLEEWESMRQPLLETIRGVFPSFMYDRGPIQPRVISSHDFGTYRVENVIFESYPGWEVNATVYLPAAPGRFPAVVCPTGHSCKTRESYQVSAQTFALNGYIAVSFDPPGCVGEIAPMNDHFTNGLIGYLTGIWSNTHFVLDAIRCIDYLETRDDVDLNAGVAMTGVSGGGATTIYASLLDDRISFLAPVCCLNEHEALHLTDWYTSCPEQFGPGLIDSGIDFTDLIALQAPKPCLIVAGRLDDLFDYRNTQRLFHDAQDIYRLYDTENQLGMFLQHDSVHAYTVEMANEVVIWMNRVFKPQTEPLRLRREELTVQEPELLHCHPSNAANMFTINKEEGRRLQASRSVPAGEAGGAYLQEQLQRLLGLEEADFPTDADYTWRAQVEEQTQTNAYRFRSVSLRTAFGYVPGLMLRRLPLGAALPAGGTQAVLMIDEDGKWSGFNSFGYLTELKETLVYNIDVSGLGELAPRPTWYDITPWSDIERIATYLSVASGQPIMGMRVRDALNAWYYLCTLPEVDPNRIILAGKGLGATVALLTSLFVGSFHKLVLWDSLLNYQALTEDFPFTWKQSIIVPNILQRLDLQDVLGHAACRTKTIINPLDAGREFVELTKARAIYPSDVQIHAGLDAGQARKAFVQAILAD
jgi:cephalosporin-C deacetylase-like acetyl esterase